MKIRKTTFALACGLFIVFQVITWSYNHSHNGVQRSFRPEKEVVTTTSTNTCSIHVTSPFKRNMKSFIETLHSIIPNSSEFLTNYTNPCWYINMSAPHSLQERVISKQKNSKLTDMEASDFMREIFDSEKEEVKREFVCIPKIYFIGFPKCGSTQLHKMIIRHPKIIHGWQKEPHWWTRFHYYDKYPHNELAIIQYLFYFQGAANFIKNHPRAMTIDSSMSTIWDAYLTADSCIMPLLISGLVPDAKYIVIMREPASRLYSDFFLVCKNSKTAPSDYVENAQDMFHNASESAVQYFKDCIENSTLDVCTYNAIWSDKVRTPCGPLRLGISLYYVHVVKWLNVIPKEKMLFLRTEDLETDPYSVMQAIWKFLDLPMQSAEELKSELYGHANVNPLSRMIPMGMKPQTKRMLKDFFQSYNEELALLLEDDKFLWNDRE